MRSAERLLKVTGLLCACAALAACASVNDLLGTARSDAPAATGPKPAVKGEAAAAAGKPGAVPATPKPEAPVSPTAQSAYASALQAMAAGRTADAERGFVALTKSDPQLAGPYANLGLLYRQSGKTAEAKAALQKAVEINAGSAELHNQLGVTYRMAGEFTKAKASYEQAITLDPAYAPAVLNLGILYDLYLWDGARALELYDRYLQLTPAGDPQVQRWISDLRNRMAKNAPQRKEQG